MLCHNYSHFTCTDAKSSVSLGQILLFLTDSDEPPPCGFVGTPKIYFTDSDRLPQANTYAFSLTLSKQHTEYALFKENMDLAISSGCGFGQI